MALQPETDNRYSRYHQQLIASLERCGFEPEEEVGFGPYSVDAYVRELHCAFEADGPRHLHKSDYERDKYLMDTCALPTVRFRFKHLGITNDEMDALVRRAAETWASTAEARYQDGLAEHGG